MNFHHIAHYMTNKCSDGEGNFIYQIHYENYPHFISSCLLFNSEKKYFVIQESHREEIENGYIIMLPQRSALIDFNDDISSTLDLLNQKNMTYAFQLLKEIISILNFNNLESILPTSDVAPKIKL